MLDHLRALHPHDILQELVVTFVGSDRAHNAVNDENIVRIHLVLGELTANGLTERVEETKVQRFIAQTRRR